MPVLDQVKSVFHRFKYMIRILLVGLVGQAHFVLTYGFL